MKLHYTSFNPNMTSQELTSHDMESILEEIAASSDPDGVIGHVTGCTMATVNHSNTCICHQASHNDGIPDWKSVDAAFC